MNKKGIFLFLICFLCLCLATNSTAEEDKNRIFATVNNEQITMQDYYSSMGDMPPGMREKYEDPKQIKRYLNKAIKQKLLLQEGIKIGIDKDPVIVKRLNDLRQRLVIDALYKRITANELIDEKLEKYYKENKRRYTRETVRASHILVKTESEVRDILKQINEGTKFEILAQKYSLDPSREKGGDLGFISRGKMAPEFDRALFELKEVGEISPIVKTRFGYHIIKLTREAQENTQPFNQVRNMIRRDLEKDLIKSYIKRLNNEAKIVISEEYK